MMPVSASYPLPRPACTWDLGKCPAQLLTIRQRLHLVRASRRDLSLDTIKSRHARSLNSATRRHFHAWILRNFLIHQQKRTARTQAKVFLELSSRNKNQSVLGSW